MFVLMMLTIFGMEQICRASYTITLKKGEVLTGLEFISKSKANKTSTQDFNQICQSVSLVLCYDKVGNGYGYFFNYNGKNYGSFQAADFPISVNYYVQGISAVQTGVVIPEVVSSTLTINLGSAVVQNLTISLSKDDILSQLQVATGSGIQSFQGMDYLLNQLNTSGFFKANLLASTCGRRQVYRCYFLTLQEGVGTDRWLAEDFPVTIQYSLASNPSKMISVATIYRLCDWNGTLTIKKSIPQITSTTNSISMNGIPLTNLNIAGNDLTTPVAWNLANGAKQVSVTGKFSVSGSIIGVTINPGNISRNILPPTLTSAAVMVNNEPETNVILSSRNKVFTINS